jgi:hypothetical protein
MRQLRAILDVAAACNMRDDVGSCVSAVVDVVAGASAARSSAAANTISNIPQQRVIRETPDIRTSKNFIQFMCAILLLRIILPRPGPYLSGWCANSSRIMRRRSGQRCPSSSALNSVSICSGIR